MIEPQSSQTIDMIRWTFAVNPDHRQLVADHLGDLGLDVHFQGENGLVATWEEPEGNVDEIIEELWAINGEPFEITHEEFHRLNILSYNHADDADDAQRAVA
ncbi:MAG: hypothetical protein ABS79_02460 [Planctomycetes bacterium SCN 63-9]|nr:MAG: hypothetical protein ABS79_02460 [Planctomycetes bacterium SCN 63-9]